MHWDDKHGNQQSNAPSLPFTVTGEASWQVLGKYGDIEIDTLTAGGTIVLADNS